MSIFNRRALAAIALVTTLAAGLAEPLHATAGEVNLYSYRQPMLMQPLLDAFTQQTGIRVNVVYAERGCWNA